MRGLEFRLMKHCWDSLEVSMSEQHQY